MDKEYLKFTTAQAGGKDISHFRLYLSTEEAQMLIKGLQSQLDNDAEEICYGFTGELSENLAEKFWTDTNLN